MQTTQAPTTEQKLEAFMDKAEQVIESHPIPVVMAMHEFFRNLFVSDPFIPFDTRQAPLDRIGEVLDRCMTFLESATTLGSYFHGNTFKTLELIVRAKEDGRSQEGKTQQLYGSLWDRFSSEQFVNESKTILSERLETDYFKLADLKGKTVLDLGCGSGRFTLGLAQFGPKKVVGFDLGAKAIERAMEMAKAHHITNVEFQVGSVLELPFADNTFDFIYCNGVLHHSDDMEKGIQEFHRVLKKGSMAWLYLYADGGIFWTARKRMNKLMKRIPKEYTLLVLDLLGMPKQRFIFPDNWYVPHERHTTRAYLEKTLKEFGFARFEPVASRRPMDFDHLVLSKAPQAKEMYGDGQLRYFVWK